MPILCFAAVMGDSWSEALEEEAFHLGEEAFHLEEEEACQEEVVILEQEE